MKLQFLTHDTIPTHPNEPPIPFIGTLCDLLEIQKVPALYIKRAAALLRDIVITSYRKEFATASVPVKKEDLMITHNRPLLVEHIWPDIEEAIAKVLSSNNVEGGTVEDKLLYVRGRVKALLLGWHTQYVEGTIPNEVFDTTETELLKLFGQDVEDAQKNESPFPAALTGNEQIKVAHIVQEAIDSRKSIDTSGFSKVNPTNIEQEVIRHMITMAAEALAGSVDPPVEIPEETLEIDVNECSSEIPDFIVTEEETNEPPASWIIFNESVILETLDELVRTLPSATYLDAYTILRQSLWDVDRVKCVEFPDTILWDMDAWLETITADETLKELDPQSDIFPRLAQLRSGLIGETHHLAADQGFQWKNGMIRPLDSVDDVPWLPVTVDAAYNFKFVEEETKLQNITLEKMTELCTDDKTGLAFAFYDAAQLGTHYPSEDATSLLTELLSRFEKAFKTEVEFTTDTANTYRVVGRVLRHLGELRLPPSLADPIAEVLQKL